MKICRGALALVALLGLTGAKSLIVVSDRPLPLETAADVRWLDGDNVAVLDALQGIAKVPVAGARATPSWLPEWSSPKSSHPLHLGVSEGHIVAADMAFQLRWCERHGSRSGLIPLEYFADVDINGPRLLIAGLRRDDNGNLGADGATAWIGTIEGGDRSLRPVLPFVTRNSIEGCAGFGIGVVRFLRDGSFIVVPGAEPDIYLYDRNARLQRKWPTVPLGIEAPCDMPYDKRVAMYVSPIGRQEWVNRRTIIDEILDTPDGPAAITRKTSGGKTTWDLVLLAGPSPVVIPLPFTSPSKWAHLTADARNGRIAFLIFDRLLAKHDNGAPPRLIVARWSAP